MKKRITLSGKNIQYTLRRSRRAKVMRLTVYGDGTLVATMPRWLGTGQIEKFILQKAKWILEKLRAPREKRLLGTGNRTDYLLHREQTRQFVEKRLVELNSIYNFDYKNISIRNQRSRWGSCSKTGNLNFNYKLIHLPEELADYIIVHELCHLKEFNHSKRFWNLVEKSIPNYKELRRGLRKI